jgi:hypothetical protein
VIRWPIVDVAPRPVLAFRDLHSRNCRFLSSRTSSPLLRHLNSESSLGTCTVCHHRHP